MSKRTSKKLLKPLRRTDPAPWLRSALAKRTKSELIDVLVTFAREDRAVLRQLVAHFKLQTPPKELLAATRQAIADATDFDERDINHNFSYDDEAYRCVAVRRSVIEAITSLGAPVVVSDKCNGICTA